MVSEKQIGSVMAALKKASRKWATPSVTKTSRTEDPYLVLVSCLLSLRTRDEITAMAEKKLFAAADTPRKMTRLSANRLGRLIRSVNFYKTKAKRIRDISKRLVKEFNGRVPADFDKLLTFKGVGRKTANIVMTYGFFKKDYLAIDTHCHRIPNRLGWIKTKTPEQTEFALRKLLPKRYWYGFNNLFVQFGQNICRPIKPRCYECPVAKYCKYYREVYLPENKAI